MMVEYIIIQQLTMQQSCSSCQTNYNGIQNVPTIICAMNHVLCRKCAIQLNNTTQKCPSCQNPITFIGPNYQQPVVQQAYQPQFQPNQPYSQENQPYFQGNQPYQNQAQPNWGVQASWNPQGNQLIVNPIPYNPRGNQKIAIVILSVMGIIFLLAGIGLIILRVKMQDCSYWSYAYYYYQCYYQGQKYCCYSSQYCTSYPNVSSYCTPLKYMDTASIPVIVGIVLNFLLAFLMFAIVASIKIRQRKMMGVNNVPGQYQRIV